MTRFAGMPDSGELRHAGCVIDHGTLGSGCAINPQLHHQFAAVIVRSVLRVDRDKWEEVDPFALAAFLIASELVDQASRLGILPDSQRIPRSHGSFER